MEASEMKRSNTLIAKEEKIGLSRRKFIRNSALGMAGLTIGGRSIEGIAFSKAVNLTAAKSKVVLVKHSQVIDSAGKLQQPLLDKMLAKAITTFSGADSLQDAWRQYVTPEDLVGLKLNTLGLMDLQRSDYNQHFTGIIASITAGLRESGIQDKNIVVWDRSDQELQSAGFSIQKEEGRLRILGSNLSRREPGIGFASTSHAVGGKTTRLSRIFTEMNTALINIPLIKTHSNAVFTCALKNHYGTIENARDFHANNCTQPGIPEINALPEIKKKQKLIIVDALLIPIEGGPRWRRNFIRPCGALLVGTDPVAIDAVAADIMDGLRKKDSLEPLVGRIPHIELAEKLGLGTAQKDNIDLQSIELG
jgi:hypothetical protein